MSTTCAHGNVNRMTPDNSVCLNCGQHWYAGREYTRKEWDDLLNDALAQEIMASACKGCPVVEAMLNEGLP